MQIVRGSDPTLTVRISHHVLSATVLTELLVALMAVLPSTFASGPDRVIASAVDICPPVWQGSAEYECSVNGIDGKKTPISFAVPLPPSIEHAALLEACGGGVRISATFRPRYCSLDNAPLLKGSLAVVLRSAEGVQPGDETELSPNDCHSVIPDSLVGSAFNLQAPYAPVPAFGIVTTQLRCCHACSP